MANCVQCGRELPSITAGELRHRCAACQFEQQQQQAAEPEPVRRKLTIREQAALWPVTATIVAINLAIYAAFAIGSLVLKQGSPMDFDTRLLRAWGADYGPFTLGGQWWRLFTAMWLHGGLIHVAANMYGLWGFGGITERIYGRSRYLLIYLATGLASSIASVAWHVRPTVSVGASGAIFGVVGALVWPFYRKRLRLPPPVMSSMFRNILMVIVINLIIGASVSVIDNAAHVGGLVAGIILGIVFVQLAVSGADHDSTLWKVAAASAIVLVASFLYARQLRQPMVLIDASYNASRRGDASRAMQLAQRAIRLDPNNMNAHVALADADLASSHCPEAAQEYLKARDLTSNAEDKQEISSRLGGAYICSQNWAAAEQTYRDILKSDSRNSEALTGLGLALAATNHPAEALSNLEQAVLFDPKSARAQFTLGGVLMDQGKFSDAIPHLSEAVRLEPNNGAYKRSLAQAEEHSGGVAPK